jgi:hypothetical protein
LAQSRNELLELRWRLGKFGFVIAVETLADFLADCGRVDVIDVDCRSVPRDHQFTI